MVFRSYLVSTLARLGERDLSGVGFVYPASLLRIPITIGPGSGTATGTTDA